jgi:hypothetical protein
MDSSEHTAYRRYLAANPRIVCPPPGPPGPAGPAGAAGPTGVISVPGDLYDVLYSNGGTGALAYTNFSLDVVTNNLAIATNPTITGATGAIAIGANAGAAQNNSRAPIAIGANAGAFQNGSTGAIAIGTNAGAIQTSSTGPIAIGINAGAYQLNNSIAIGTNAGATQAANAIAIGAAAGTSQTTSSIILNASGTAGATTDSAGAGFYVSPVQTTSSTTGFMIYSPTTKEIQYNTASLLTNPATAALNMDGHEILNARDIIPETTDTYTLGTSALRWKDLFMGPGSIQIGEIGADISISTTGSTIAVSATSTNGYDLIASYSGITQSLIRYTQPSRGYVITVDKLYGAPTVDISDTFRRPFSTISAAITAASGLPSLPIQILVHPGVYEEQFTIPPNVSIRGTSVNTVTIAPVVPGASTSFTGITMDINSRLEDITLNLTSSSSNQILTGIAIDGTAAQSSKLRTSVINVTQGGGLTGGTLTGIKCTGAGSILRASSNAVRATTVNVNGTTGVSGATCYGLFAQDTNRISVRDCNIYANGYSVSGATTGPSIIGACAANNSIIELRTSTVAGGTYTGALNVVGLNNDILQQDSTATIFLGMSDLANRTTGNKGFELSTQYSTMGFSLKSGNAVVESNRTYGLLPGTFVVNSTTNPPLTIPLRFSQPTLVQAINTNCSGATTNPAGITFTITNTVTGLSIVSSIVGTGGTASSPIVLPTQSLRIGANEEYTVTALGVALTTGTLGYFTSCVTVY